MITTLLTLITLCPVLDTGLFHFKEFINSQSGIDTFYGDVYVSPQKNIKLNVLYPDSQLFTFNKDTIYMVVGEDTQKIYKKGLEKLIFKGISCDSVFAQNRIRHGCRVLSRDSTLLDTLFIFGNRFIDSIYFIGQSTKVKLYLLREE